MVTNGKTDKLSERGFFYLAKETEFDTGLLVSNSIYPHENLLKQKRDRKKEK